MLLVNLFLVCLAISLGAAKEMVQDNWLFREEEDSSIEISGSKLKVNNGTVGFDALYLGIVANETNKRFYWEFTCVQSCIAVGVAKKDFYNVKYSRQIYGGNAGEQTRYFND